MDKKENFSKIKDLIKREEKLTVERYQKRDIPSKINSLIIDNKIRKKYNLFASLLSPVPIGGIALLLIIFTFGLLYRPHKSYQNKVEHILANIPALQNRIPTTNQTTTKQYNYQLQQLENNWETKMKDPTIREKNYTSQYLEKTFMNILTKKRNIDKRSLK